ncbi:histidine phosphatase family protein [Cryobacterium sp. TMT1-21]|uniref:Histidine phosphatase family protein n=2 Tax=Microbacteriaceae TaxID=85023 RepID=A0AAQ2C8P1_9MICO|nr:MULTISPECIES: histidine phosphatase family protein [Cryobacterium]TFC52261.1 histidine phosphatase family protein [Cryobacterium shii]TFD15746.1 histidine phosphatase family protein [Cryobacterium sp. TMT1-21]TFD19024.1 histidine phosphatase family protein [Cryobacterium sp. TMT2-23]TFD21015.1 histidine phosphatase family protein [Cryobacterium sp. TMT4-10]TFD39443.1 histidine phosphatase family protein [Cryobacterium sp. TMT2-10]
MRLFLIRHGQTPANVLGQLDTSHPGPGLTELGTRQAAVIPDTLRLDSVDAIFASTLRRTQLTARPLAADRSIEVRVSPGLHEIEAGSLEGLNDPASVHTYMQTVFAWGAGDLDARMPGASDGHAFFARYDADIAAATADVETAAVFSHGAAIRVWTAARTLNMPPRFAGSHDLENTGVVELSGSATDGWTLVSWVGLRIGGPLADLDTEGAQPVA